jgi:hypothetical protein
MCDDGWGPDDRDFKYFMRMKLDAKKRMVVIPAHGSHRGCNQCWQGKHDQDVLECCSMSTVASGSRLWVACDQAVHGPFGRAVVFW